MANPNAKPNGHPPPSWYDDLEGTLAQAWRLVSRGAKDRRAEAHTPAVSTIGLDGAPQVRTVVLRAADPTARTATFHTDARSAKIEEIARDGRCSLLIYERSAKAQVRLQGRAVAHIDDAVAEEAWARTRPMSRICYHVTTAPGAALDDSNAPAFDPAATNDGRDHFACVVLHVEEIEWLYLHYAGHRRAKFSWLEDGWQKTWLIP